MPDLNIGQQGKLKSMPKIVRINGDDDKKAIYRKYGQQPRLPICMGKYSRNAAWRHRNGCGFGYQMAWL